MRVWRRLKEVFSRPPEKIFLRKQPFRYVTNEDGEGVLEVADRSLYGQEPQGFDSPINVGFYVEREKAGGGVEKILFQTVERVACIQAPSRNIAVGGQGGTFGLLVEAEGKNQGNTLYLEKGVADPDDLLEARSQLAHTKLDIYLVRKDVASPHAKGVSGGGEGARAERPKTLESRVVVSYVGRIEERPKEFFQ
ncbi:hypothetical protein D6783_04325 [Candidatus Woesearchaeota archaeon]|nr:MAG: hypothetical protein D6783_04325 [Candidatus Woesearchaeota archaeon]